MATALELFNLSGQFANQYCASAYLSATTQSIGAGETQITLDGVAYDFHNNFSASTCTAPVNGIYMIAGQVALSAFPAANTALQVELRAGTNVFYGTVSPFLTTMTSAWPASGGAAIAPLSAGQTVQLWVFNGSGTVTVDNSIGRTYLNIALVSIL